MKQIFKFSALALILAISFSSCKKYEDGPGFSLRSKKGRLCGDWKLKSSNIDGKDQSISDDAKDDTWKIMKDDKIEFVDPGNDTQKGTWAFESKKEKFTIKMDLGGNSTVDQTYTILQLNNKEIKLSFTDIFDQKRIEVYDQ